MGIRDRLAHAWNAFVSEDDSRNERPFSSYGGSFSTRPDRLRTSINHERSLIASVYARLSIDVASIGIRHIRRGPDGEYKETIKSSLNERLSVEANIDQAGSQFRQDIALTLFDKGVAAIVPVETSVNPESSSGYDILSLRVGEIVAWYPEHVRVSVYNEAKGRREEVTRHKRTVAIVENPLYSVMNEPNSTLRRIIHKLSILDAVDEAAGSGKLDLIIQLPYVVKSDARRAQAEQRRGEIETQLKGSKYGIAYTDGTEKITQLNRPAENNMMKQIEYLMNQFYNQLGMTAAIFDGTADEETLTNYHNRTVEPIMRAITEAMHRTFLSKTARTQGQAIDFVRDPFKLVPLTKLAELADKFTRNEIMSANEIRVRAGLPPVDAPAANELRNKNMPVADTEPNVPVAGEPNLDAV